MCISQKTQVLLNLQTLQLCWPTHRSEREVLSIISTEFIGIYQNTKITVNRVEHQTLENLENGLIASQQQSQCYINQH